LIEARRIHRAVEKQSIENVLRIQKAECLPVG
jgi:hypothetical protein